MFVPTKAHSDLVLEKLLYYSMCKFLFRPDIYIYIKNKMYYQCLVYIYNCTKTIQYIYITIHGSNLSAMVYADKWIPAPWNKREQELRKIKDLKNKRERKRKNARAEERAEDHNLLLAANAWMTEEFDEQDGETASSTQKQQSSAGNDDVDERQKGDEQNKENDVNGECENNELCSKHMDET